MESVLNGETSENCVTDVKKSNSERIDSVEGQPKQSTSSEKDTLSSMEIASFNNHEDEMFCSQGEEKQIESTVLNNEPSIVNCPKEKLANDESSISDTQLFADKCSDPDKIKNTEVSDFSVQETTEHSIESLETSDSASDNDDTNNDQHEFVSAITTVKNNSSFHAVNLTSQIKASKAEIIDPCLTLCSKDSANSNTEEITIDSSESQCDDSVMLVDNDDTSNDSTPSIENEDSKDIENSVVNTDMSEDDDSKDVQNSVAAADGSENDDCKSIENSSALENDDSKDTPNPNLLDNNDSKDAESSVISTVLFEQNPKFVDNSTINVNMEAKTLNEHSNEISLEKEGKSNVKSESESPVLCASEGLDLSMKPTAAKDDAQHASLKVSDVVTEELSDFEVEPLNFSSRSNKSDLSSETKQFVDNTHKALNNANITEKLNRSDVANSDNESVSSEGKLCSEDSESMDCEENSSEETNVPHKKTNDHFNALENVDKHYQKDETRQHEKVDKIRGDGRVPNTSSTSEKGKHDSTDSDNLVFTELSNEETGFPAAFSGLVTIGKYISVKGDFTLRSTEALVESPSLVAPFLLKEPDKFPVKDKRAKPEAKGFFHSSAGEFLIGIGLSRVNEWFHRDMARIKKRQIKREGKLPHLEEELDLHQNSYAEAKKANDIFSFSYKTCETCKFTTESSIVMEGHLLVPHITPRREYQCNFCSVVNRDPREMLFHMESAHKKVGRIQPPVLFYECPFCTFESNSKVKLNSHLSKCQKFFDHAINQAAPKDFEFPALTPKPITVAVVKAYERSLSSMHRGRGRPKKVNSMPESMHHPFSPNLNTRPIAPNQNLSGFRSNPSIPLADSMSIQNQIIPQVPLPSINLRPAHSNTIGQLRSGMPPLHLPSTNRFFQVVNSSGQILPMLGNSHLVTSPSQFPFSSNLANTGQKKLHSNTPFFNSLFGNGLRQQTPGKNSCDLTISTPLPKLQGPYPVQLTKSATPSGNSSLQSSSLVVCEICDGYIKDLEQLRTHMQLIHKVKIHPKMLVSRPPLNCQKCQWRFFTDQGLERHLLGAHGLVTSNMQELANKNKDAGCCTICGRVYASKLVSHMSQVHKVTLKPAHLSYKCTVCSATFNLYRLFENHVYLVHSGAAKRPSDGGISPAKKLSKTRENSDKSDLLLDEPKNHKEKSSSGEKRLSHSKDDQMLNKCKDCGNDITTQLHERRKCAIQNEKCEKCLKSDGLLQGMKNYKEELIKKEGIEEVAF